MDCSFIAFDTFPFSTACYCGEQSLPSKSNKDMIFSGNFTQILYRVRTLYCINGYIPFRSFSIYFKNIFLFITFANLEPFNDLVFSSHNFSTKVPPNVPTSPQSYCRRSISIPERTQTEFQYRPEKKCALLRAKSPIWRKLARNQIWYFCSRYSPVAIASDKYPEIQISFNFWMERYRWRSVLIPVNLTIRSVFANVSPDCSLPEHSNQWS